MWLVAHMNSLNPVVSMDSPVSVHKWLGYVSLQLSDTQTQSGHREDPIPINCAIPLEI